MHLRAIKLRGFKSFPDPVEVRLEPGVAVVVGPNGSGKSNVADAIVWAAGSLAPHELRAEKPDDVLFSGLDGAQAGRPSARSSSSSTTRPATGRSTWSEVAIARRLHRGGEGQYLVNRRRVRRLDLVELLADVGPRRRDALDHRPGQGRGDPRLEGAERRVLLEEAAGLGSSRRGVIAPS